MESPFQTNLFEFQNKLAVGKFVKAMGRRRKGGYGENREQSAYEIIV